jgi:hypothetical protein
LAEQAPKIFVRLSPEVVVFLFQLLLQRMEFLEGPGIRNGYSSLIGEQSEPFEVLVEKRRAPKSPENAKDFFAKGQWMAGKAMDAFPTYPFWVCG